MSQQLRDLNLLDEAFRLQRATLETLTELTRSLQWFAETNA